MLSSLHYTITQKDIPVAFCEFYFFSLKITVFLNVRLT